MRRTQPWNRGLLMTGLMLLGLGGGGLWSEAGAQQADPDNLKLSLAALTAGASPFDINGNGVIELPVGLDPALVDPAVEATKAQVLKRTITHEAGHGIGMIHNTVAGCAMNSPVESWTDDGCFSQDSQALATIHNKNTP